MKISSLRYLTKEGFRNVWVNRLMSLASVTVLMACLIMIGLGTMLYLNVDLLLNKIESQNVVLVYIEDGVEPSVVGNKIKVIDNVSNCEFVPKEDAWEAQKKLMGDDAVLLEGMENPMPDAYKVTVADLTKFDSTVNELKMLDNVESIRENGDVADKLVSIRKAVTIVAIGIVVLLATPFTTELIALSNFSFSQIIFIWHSPL